MRVWELVLAVEREAGVSAEKLARRFGVSERTIRADVRRANDVLASAAHIEKERGGVTVSW